MSKKLQEQLAAQEEQIAALKYHNISLRQLLEVVINHSEDPRNGLFECIGVAIKQGENLCSTIIKV